MPVLASRRVRTAGCQLVSLGDLLLDVVVMPERPIERGTDVPGALSFRRGGSAANTAAAFVRAGGSASLITCVGDDYWAARLLAALRADGVRVHAIRHRGPSGRLAAFVDEHGQRSFITQRGAADQIRPTDLGARWLAGAAALHVPAYSLFGEPIGRAALSAASMAHQQGALVSIDVSSQGPLLRFGIRNARARFAEMAPDILFANRDEAATLLQRSGRRAWPGLLDLAALVVVKDGAAGCRVLWREREAGVVRQLDVATGRVRSVDSTGAGDAFAGGFLFALLSRVKRDDPASASDLRRAALAGHRAAADLLRRAHSDLKLA